MGGDQALTPHEPREPREPGRSGARGPGAVVACLAILAVAFAVYGNHLGNELVLDDKAWIPTLSTVRDPLDLRAILGSRFFLEFRPDDTLYRPLLVWSLAVNWRLNELLGAAGADPLGYRVVDVLLHAGAACALRAFLRTAGAGRGAALAAALVFVAHPLVSEAVLSIVNRSEALAAGFGFAFLALHRRGRSVAAAVCLAAALLAKESALAFALVAPWSDLVLGRPSDATGAVEPVRRTVLRHALYAGTAAGWLALRGAVVAGTDFVVPFVSNPLVAEGPWVRTLTAAATQLRYLRLAVLPVGLSSDSSYDAFPLARSVLDPRVLGFALVAAAALVLAVRTRRALPMVAFAVGAWVLLFGPTANVVLPIGTLFAERLAYAPLMALVALAVVLAERVLPARVGTPRRAALVGLVVAALGALTVARSRSWRDEGTFYAAQLASAPGSAAAWHNAAVHLYERRDLAGAIEHERRALAILPDFHPARNALAVALAESGRLEEARSEFAELVRREPRYVLGHFGLGQTLQLQGRRAEARAAYERALMLDAGHLASRVKLAELHAQAGRLAEARAELARALERDPAYAPALRLAEQLRGR